MRYWAWRVEFLVGGMRQEKVGVELGLNLFVCLFGFVHCLLAARYALLSSVRVSGSLWFFCLGLW